MPAPPKMLTPPSSTIVMMSSSKPLADVAAHRAEAGGVQHAGDGGDGARSDEQAELAGGRRRAPRVARDLGVVADDVHATAERRAAEDHTGQRRCPRGTAARRTGAARCSVVLAEAVEPRRETVRRSGPRRARGRGRASRSARPASRPATAGRARATHQPLHQSPADAAGGDGDERWRPRTARPALVEPAEDRRGSGPSPRPPRGRSRPAMMTNVIITHDDGLLDRQLEQVHQVVRRRGSCSTE